MSSLRIPRTSSITELGLVPNLVENLMKFLTVPKNEPDVPFVKKSIIYVSDSQSLRRKLQSIISFGPQSLQIVADFDQTITKYCSNGTPVPVCHGIFLSHPDVPVTCKDKLRKLLDIYMPIEVSAGLQDGAKIPYMTEWWNLSHEAIAQTEMQENELKRIVAESGLILRHGVTEFLLRLQSHAIPILIFSGGIGNVIEIVLDQVGLCTSNVRVLSNFMDFNHESVLIGFQDPIIHSLNKTMAVIENSDYDLTTLSKRPCVLLLGDSLNDAHMVEETSKGGSCGTLDTVLRIGFLNGKTDDDLSRFKAVYDIVLRDDETFDVPLAILDAILKRSI